MACVSLTYDTTNPERPGDKTLIFYHRDTTVSLKTICIPLDVINDGKSNDCGLHDMTLRGLILFLLASQALRTNTVPGESAQNLKWYIIFIPFNAVVIVCSAK